MRLENSNRDEQLNCEHLWFTSRYKKLINHRNTGRLFLLMIALLTISCGLEGGIFRGKVVDMDTNVGIDGVVIYCTDFGDPITVDQTPDHSADGGMFNINYTTIDDDLSPRLCAFLDEDGRSNGGLFIGTMIALDPWHNEKGNERVIYMAKLP